MFSRAALEYARLRGRAAIRSSTRTTGRQGWCRSIRRCISRRIRSSAACPSIFTIHNLAFQGIFPATTLPSIGLGWEVLDMQALEYWGQISYLKGGIKFSERLTTVSPTYAREILTPEFGFGFDGALQTARGRIDRDPQRDRRRALESRSATRSSAPAYGADDLSGKEAREAAAARNRRVWPTTRSRGEAAHRIVSRLTDQKGFDLIAAAVAASS